MGGFSVFYFPQISFKDKIKSVFASGFISFWEPSADDDNDDIEGVQLGGFGAVQLERLEPESGGLIK